MSYERSAVQRELDIIRRHVPRAALVATDLVGDLSERALDMCAIHLTKGSVVRLEMANRIPVADRTIDRFRKAMNVTPEAAKAVYDASRTLYKLNDRGAWCVSPMQQTPRIVTSQGVDGHALHPYAEDCFLGLQELLPNILRLHAESFAVGHADGRTKRRIVIHALTHDDHEVAAIDTAAFSTHIRDVLMPDREEKFSQANLVRASVWAKQLGTDPNDLPEILHAASLFFVTLQATEVQLVAGKPKVH